MRRFIALRAGRSWPLPKTPTQTNVIARWIAIEACAVPKPLHHGIAHGDDEARSAQPHDGCEAYALTVTMFPAGIDR